MLIGGVGLLVIGLIRASQSLRVAVGVSAIPGALAMVAYQLCFFAAVRSTGVAIGTVVTLGTAPVLAGTLGWIFLRERPIRAWFLATGLALVGCLFLTVIGEEVDADASGVALALGAGLSYAVYVIATKRLVASATPLAATTVTFCAAGILMLPLLMSSDMAWLYTGRGLVVALHLGLMTTSIAYLMFSTGMMTTPVSTATTLSLAKPVTATLLATLVLGERLTLTTSAGSLLVLSGLVVLALAARNKRQMKHGTV